MNVHGTSGSWLIHPSTAERAASRSQENDEPTIVPLSPFDSLIWIRSRQRTLFDKHYVLEAYKPAHKRDFGYFSMPILVGTQLAGRIAARAVAGKLLLENLELDSHINHTRAYYCDGKTPPMDWYVLGPRHLTFSRFSVEYPAAKG